MTVFNKSIHAIPMYKSHNIRNGCLIIAWTENIILYRDRRSPCWLMVIAAVGNCRPPATYWSRLEMRCMLTSSNGNISALLAFGAGNPPVTGEFPTHWPVTWIFDVFFDLCLNRQLSKQWRRWWFETLPRSLWRHCNVKCDTLQYLALISQNVWNTRPIDCPWDMWVNIRLIFYKCFAVLHAIPCCIGPCYVEIQCTTPLFIQTVPFWGTP